MYTLYAITNCDTVKKARVWLAERGISYQFHDYKKLGIDRPTLDRWLIQRSWQELVNQNGTTWRKLIDAEKPISTEAAIGLMLAKPSVIRRPLIEADGIIVALGFGPEQYEAIFLK